MEIRRAEPGDADAFASVIAAVADEDRWILTEPPLDRGAFAERVHRMLAEGRDMLWVMIEEGEVVGCLGLHGTPVAGVYSLGMGILETMRGAGRGGALLDAALADARRSGVHKVELEVFPDNPRAIALYASRGFAVEGLRREHHPRRDGTRRSTLLLALLLGSP